MKQLPPYRRPKPPPEPPKPPDAVAEMMAAEFDAKEWGTAGGMIVSNPPPPQSEPVERWTPPPPPWSEHYQGEPAEDEPTDQPEPPAKREEGEQ